jgi:5-methylthioribose kinase
VLREGAARGVLRAGRALILERRALDTVETLTAETSAILQETVTRFEF